MYSSWMLYTIFQYTIYIMHALVTHNQFYTEIQIPELQNNHVIKNDNIVFEESISKNDLNPTFSKSFMNKFTIHLRK